MKIPQLLTTLALVFVMLLPVAAQEKNTGYRLKVGDQLSINVAREEELNKDFRVNQAGEASFRYIGSLNLAGLTIEEARKQITVAYDDGWLVEPDIMIDLISAAAEVIQVTGAVNDPGEFEIPKGKGKGLDLASAIALAGSFNRNADPNRVTVKRGKDKQTYRYSNILKGKPIQLIDGDLIEVGINPNAGARVSVIGEVNNPGAVAMPNDGNLTAGVALGLRGGPSLNAAKGGWTIKRGTKTLPAGENTRLLANDVLDIPINRFVNKKVVVLGEVKRPGAVAFNLNGKMSIAQAIGLAGGKAARGDLKEVTVLRNGRPLLPRKNVKRMSEGKEAMFMLEPGDELKVPPSKW